ncbi:hypothetical protein TeGR_g7249 [Tetraparma gracilis]|uniref:RRM domain-containing protein n=1 Tax=Tetraparma gracilis TaxID=2962635 RepID=A0ABQ6M6V8_9STRA|nr:hypothetical protein TeGR_g7249 [Tetraparma gracilis]
MHGIAKGRKSTPKGQMAMSTAGPAVSLLPPALKVAFGPEPPPRFLPKPRRKSRLLPYSGVAKLVGLMSAEAEPRERGARRKGDPGFSRVQAAAKAAAASEVVAQGREAYDKARSDHGMDPFNTVFVGRLAYDVTEADLLREFGQAGQVKDIVLVTVKRGERGEQGEGDEAGGGDDAEDGGGAHSRRQQPGSSRGYAFVEYCDPKGALAAFRSMDGKPLHSRPIVVDVERANTVKGWYPQRLGGGQGARRRGGKGMNVMYPGRVDGPGIVNVVVGGAGGWIENDNELL